MGRLSKKQKKKLAAQKLQQEKEEKERQEKEAAEAAAAELLAQTSKKKKKKKTKKQVEGESQPAPAPESKKKGKKKAEEAPIEPEPALTTQDADEDTDGWEKVPSQSRKSRRKRGGGNNSAEGKSQAPKGPIVQEILELGARPNDNKADDPVRKKILDVLGFPSRKSPDSAVAEVLIPNRRKAALIGTRGANIQRIQQAYNCRINVPQNLPGQKPNDKVSVIIAGEKALIAAAVADVKESVAEPEPEQLPGFSKELTCEYDPWAED